MRPTPTAMSEHPENCRYTCNAQHEAPSQAADADNMADGRAKMSSAAAATSPPRELP